MQNSHMEGDLKDGDQGIVWGKRKRILYSRISVLGGA